MHRQRRLRAAVHARERVAEEDAPTRIRRAGDDLEYAGVSRQGFVADRRAQEVAARGGERAPERRLGSRAAAVFERSLERAGSSRGGDGDASAGSENSLVAVRVRGATVSVISSPATAARTSLSGEASWAPYTDVTEALAAAAPG